VFCGQSEKVRTGPVHLCDIYLEGQREGDRVSVHCHPTLTGPMQGMTDSTHPPSLSDTDDTIENSLCERALCCPFELQKMKRRTGKKLETCHYLASGENQSY